MLMTDVAQIHAFLLSLELPTRLDSEANKKYNTLGLVIFSNYEKVSVADVIYQIQQLQRKTRVVVINNSFLSDSFNKELFQANKNGEWLVVEVHTDISGEILKVFSQINDEGKFTLNDFQEQEMVNVNLNPNTRIIVCLSNDVLENKLNNETFLKNFGPILRFE